MARFAVVDAIAIAEVETVCRAKPPNGVLNEPRKIARKLPVEGSGIDQLRHVLDDVGAAALGVAADTILMGLAAAVKNPGSVQKVMDQGINCDHVRAGLKPNRPIC